MTIPQRNFNEGGPVSVASIDPAKYSYLVYSGSEKWDLGDARVTAFCASREQAEALILGMWPGTGYWRRSA